MLFHDAISLLLPKQYLPSKEEEGFVLLLVLDFVPLLHDAVSLLLPIQSLPSKEGCRRICTTSGPVLYSITTAHTAATPSIPAVKLVSFMAGLLNSYALTNGGLTAFTNWFS